MKRFFLVSVMTIVVTGCGSLSATQVPSAAPASTEVGAATAPSSNIPPTNTPEATTAPTPTGAPPAATTYPDPKGFQWAPVVSGLTSPVDIEFPDDGSGRMFILEQAGTIRILLNGQLLSSPFLDIRDKVGSGGNEQGLLGLAFHPQFRDNPFFYINYTDVNGDTVIARFLANDDTADPSSEKDLIHVKQPFPNHNGGEMTFGPDGYLYSGLGDGGSAGDPFGNAQNTTVLLGKILRLDVDNGDAYKVPPDSPFGNEIWDYGLRNPWRFSFDKANGDLFIGDVGQDTWEEVDYAPVGEGGLNFGWNYREASHPFRGQPPASQKLTYPVAEYSHANSRCSITGGFVYRGSMPEWQGIYLYSDYCSGEIWGMLRSAASKTGWDSKVLFGTGANVTSFGQDPAGEIYFAGRAGTIYQLRKK